MTDATDHRHADADGRFDYEAAADARVDAARPTSRWVWPGLPLMMLAAVVVVDVSMIVVASRDRSFAVAATADEGDAGWERTVARRAANEATGWTPRVEVHRAGPGLPSTVLVRLEDAAGVPVEGATVRAEAFHHALASERRDVTFEELLPGVHQAFCELSRDGRWAFDLVIERGDEAWIDRTDVMVGTEGDA